HPDQRETTEDPEEADGDADPADAETCEQQTGDDVADADRRDDRSVKAGIATEHIADEDRQSDVERPEVTQNDDRPGEDEDPEPGYREGVGEALPDLAEQRCRGGDVAPRPMRER